MPDKFCILFHYHEISLKGKNRSWFERQLIKNIKIQLRNLPLLKIELISARIFCHGIDSSRWSEYVDRINKISCFKLIFFKLSLIHFNFGPTAINSKNGIKNGTINFR